MYFDDKRKNEERSINPWVNVSYEDYNQHMKAPLVFQAQILGKIFGNHLQETKPETVLVLGCACGNGFEYIDDSVTKVVTGIDINQKFLSKCKEEFNNEEYVLNLVCCDFEKDDSAIESVDFISCALFLEYVDIKGTLIKIKSVMNPGSKLNIVIQKNNINKFVSETGIKSLESLASIAKEISEKELNSILERTGFVVENRETYELPNGKEFVSYCCQVSERQD